MRRIHVIPPKRIVELYRSDNFEAESLTSVNDSQAKIAADGLVSTENVNSHEDGHLTASPKLPSLMDRCSRSKTKGLYNLSLQLLDQDVSRGYESDWSEAKPKNCDQDRYHHLGFSLGHKQKRTYNRQNEQLSMKKPGEKLDGIFKKRSFSTPKMKTLTRNPRYTNKTEQVKEKSLEHGGESFRPFKYKHRKLTRKISNSSSALCKQPVITATKQPKIEGIFPRRAYNNQPDAKPFRYSENPRNTYRTFFKSQEPKKIAEHSLNKKNQKNIHNGVGIKEVLKSWASEQLDFILHVIDENHLYTLIFLLATLVYLAYILIYDVSENLNEQRRYLAKLESAGLAMKCFYYLMRLLRAPIF